MPKVITNISPYPIRYNDIPILRNEKWICTDAQAEEAQRWIPADVISVEEIGPNPLRDWETVDYRSSNNQ